MMARLFFMGGLLFCCLNAYSQAVQYGHLNFNNLIVLMPESKSADEALKTYQEELVEKGEKMDQEIRKKILDFSKMVDSGQMSPAEQAKKEKELLAEREAIRKFEVDASRLVQEKRQELLNPIVEKARSAIAEAAKENNCVMVFDTGLFNAILFADESIDLMPKVKAKLGLQ